MPNPDAMKPFTDLVYYNILAQYPSSNVSTTDGISHEVNSCGNSCGLGRWSLGRRLFPLLQDQFGEALGFASDQVAQSQLPPLFGQPLFWRLPFLLTEADQKRFVGKTWQVSQQSVDRRVKDETQFRMWVPRKLALKLLHFLDEPLHFVVGMWDARVDMAVEGTWPV